jgi:futalosine hydrolase
MNILIVSATTFEIAPLLKEINADIERKTISSYNYKQHQITILITGVGIAHTGFYLGKYLNDKYDMVINTGICGSFNYTLSIGDVVRIDEDCFADLGAEDDEKFLSIEELKLPGTYHVRNENTFSHAILSSTKSAKGTTVNTTHGNIISIDKFISRTKADVESMEGAAFLFACNQTKIRCLQLRAISNYVEKRDRSKWNIPLAIENLNVLLINFIKIF